MLDLALLIAAEKAIIANDGSVSLITIMEAVEVKEDAAMPKEFLFPMRWMVLTLWRRNEKAVDGTEFEQETRIVGVDGDAIMNHKVAFKIAKGFINYRNLATFFGFPISTSGVARVEIYLRKKGQTRWRLEASYPITVVRHAQKEKKINENDDKNNRKPARDVSKV